MAMCPSVKYTPCATSLREQTGNIITLSQFEEGDILSETRAVDAYSKIPKLYGMEKFPTKKVMDNMDMFQSRFEKMD